jgi:guanidinopropionase
MRAPFTEDWSAVDIGLIGVPFDAGTTYRPGARFGPREMRNQSTFLNRIHHRSNIAPFDLCRIADLGDVWVETPFHLELAINHIAAFYKRISASGITPLTAGGDHSIALPILRGIAAGRKLGLLHIDAHADTSPGRWGSNYYHGGPFRMAVEEGLIDPMRTVQIGIRGSLPIPDLWKYSTDVGMRFIEIEDCHDMGWPNVIAEARRIVGDEPTYISFDIDSLDPAFAPGTGTPEVGGLTPIEAQMLIRGFRGLNLVGADVVEVSPPFDPTGTTALVGATIMFELLCVLADARAARGNRA